MVNMAGNMALNEFVRAVGSDKEFYNNRNCKYVWAGV